MIGLFIRPTTMVGTNETAAWKLFPHKTGVILHKVKLLINVFNMDERNCRERLRQVESK